MRRYALRDDQWDRIKDSLPGRIATRYDKLAKTFLAGVQLACAAMLLN